MARKRGCAYPIHSRDHRQQRLVLPDATGALNLSLDRDGFAGYVSIRIAIDRPTLAFRREPRGDGAHRTVPTVARLPAGRYAGPGVGVAVRTDDAARIVLPIATDAPRDIAIAATARAAAAMCYTARPFPRSTGCS